MSTSSVSSTGSAARARAAPRVVPGARSPLGERGRHQLADAREVVRAHGRVEVVGIRRGDGQESLAGPGRPRAPSGTRATEPMATEACGKRNSRLESRTWPQRGLPELNSDSKPLS